MIPTCYKDSTRIALSSRLYRYCLLGTFVLFSNYLNAVTVDFNAATYTVGESDGTVTITVDISGDPEEASYISWERTGGTATTDDYTFGSQALSFANGSTSSATFSITIDTDACDEANETIILGFTGEAGGITGASGQTSTTITITDDDATPTISFSTSAASISEDTDGEVEVTLSSYSCLAPTVDYALTENTATDGGVDFTETGGTLTINSNKSGSVLTNTFTVDINDDALDEADENFTIAITDPSNSTLGSTTTHTYTISDDDATPTIYFTNATANGAESTTSVNAGLTLSAASGQNVAVNYSVTGGTATGSGTDFTLSAGTATITGNASTTTKNIAITIVNDALDEADETIIITIASPTNASITGVQTTHTYTITDNDDTPSIAFTATSSDDDEDEASAPMQLTLSAASGRDVTVDYALSGTATGSGTDYTLANGTATITGNAGTTTQNITATIVDDSIDETNETVIVTISNPTYASLGTNQTHTYTITDDEATPTIQFTDTDGASSGSEATASPNIEVSTNLASYTSMTVDYAITGTATGSGTDYTLANGTATITAGNTTTNITPTIVNDDLYEEGETIIVTLSGASASSLGGRSVHTYTINNDDSAPTIAFTDATSSGAESTTPASLGLTLSAVSGLDATVGYAVTSGTATGSGTDYTLASGTATVSAGATTTSIAPVIVSDALDEDNEYFVVTLSSPTNSSIGTNSTHTFTITDDDALPEIAFTSTSSSAAEGSTPASIGLTLSPVSGRDVTVAYAVTGTATGGGTDYTLADGTATISAGSTTTNVSAVIVADTRDEPNETVILTVSGPTNANLGTNTTHTYTITDDDDAPSIAFPAATNASAESANPVFVPTLSAASGIDINVSYAVGGTSTATGGGTDYTLADGTATITAGNTSTNVTATINNDALDEDNETIVLTLSNPVYSTSQTPSPSLGTNSTITHTITDDDDSPAIGFSSASSSGAEATTPGTFIVNLSAVSGKDITASYALTGTATGGGTDYTLADGTVTITAGNTADTLSAVITDDYVVEDDETVIVTLSSPTNSTVGTAAHTYTITNDDEGPSAFNYYSIYTDGGTEYYNYWNSTNTGLEVKVKVENNTKLVGGTIQVQAKVTEANSYTNIGDAYTIQATDLGKVGWSGGTWYDVVLLPVISAASVEALTPFTELATLYVRVIITDSYGNSTTSSNAKTFTIDQTAPADNTVGAVVSAEGTVVAGYYNSTNTSVDVTVPFDTDDTTLKGGYIQIYSKKSILDTDYWDKIYSCGNSGEFDEADTSTCDSTYNTYIDAAELATGSLNISLTDTGGSYVYYTDAEGTQHKSDPTDFEEANGFAEQANMEFRAVVRDIAGNSTTYTKSSTTLTVDQTPAVLVEVTSSTDDGYYNEGDTIAVTLEFDQVVDVSGAPRIELEIGDPDVKVDYISGTGTNTLTFRYVVSDAHNSDKLAYTDTTAFDLNGATIRDPAGNPLSSLILFKTGATGSLSSNKNLRIDTIAPTCSLTYVNLTQTSLENLGKGDDQIQVIGNFNETVQSTPTLSVVFADPTDVSITGLEFTGSTNSDSTWTYTFTLPTGTSYTGNMTVTPAYFDLAGNALSTLSGATDFEIDNTPPAAFQTGDVVPMGSLPKTGWFNAGTDSLSITIPIQTTDNSLLQGKIQPRMQITTVTGSLADIGPSTTLINIAVPVKEIFVKKADIRSSFSATDFAQGVKLLTNVDLYDRAGNVTVGSLNLDTLVVDTISPVVGSYVTEISGSVAVVDTTLVSSDSLYARWTQFVDNSLLGESGVADYQWAVGRFGSADLDSVQELISAGLDTFLTGKAPLRDSTRYDLSVLAVDSAGNVSQTLQTTTGFYRLNSAPIISTIDTITTKEQVDLSYQVTATDLDLSTLLGDTLHYNFLNNLILQDSLVLLTDSAAAKINTSSGLLTWQTPLHSDTVSYPVTLNVSDEWGRSTNEIFVLTVNANTRPKVSTAPDTVMNEAGRGVNHRSIMEYTFKVHDPDDELVTINAFSDSTQIHVSPSDTIVATTGRDTVDVIFTFEVDSFWTKESKITLSLTDEKLITTETFIIDVLRVARPQMWITFAQNPSFTRFFELMVIDTVGKVNLDTSDVYNLYKPRKEPLILYVYEKQGEVLKPEGEVDLSYIDSYVWVGNFEFDTTSTYCYEMNVIGVVGDTVVTPCTNVVFARARQSWVGSSTDGIFKVNAKSGAVAFDKPFMIVDSLLLYHDEPYDARYRMGHQMVTFEKPVMVSLQADSSLPEEDQAIYQISRDSFWKELPTISKNGELLAWTSNMGYFKIGERTIIVPEETALGSNYPNPFNALTHITFDVGFFGGLEQRVDVSIYNLLGQKVKTVHDDILLIGRHDLVWDGRDTHGVPVSSGIYIVGFSSDGGVRQARKMMLVR